MKASSNPSRAACCGLLLLLFFAVVLIAKANVLTFPFPNEDEAYFFLPGWNLVTHGSLKPEILNASNGIYWMPHGYYLWLSFFLWIFGPTIEVARSANQATTAAAVALLTWAHARISRSWVFAAVCALLLVSPATIFSANAVRMESLIFLLYSIAMLCHSYRRHLLAAEILTLSFLVHPALIIGAPLYMVSSAFLSHERRSGPAAGWLERIGPSEVVIGALVLAAIASEATLVAAHMSLFHQQMAYQAHRKAMRNPLTSLLHKRGIFLIIETVLAVLGFSILAYRRDAAVRRYLKASLPVALTALGLQAYATFGYEGTYAIYSYAVVPATLLSVAYGALSAMSEGRKPCESVSGATAQS